MRAPQPGILTFSSPTLATFTRPTQRVLCPRWASARASQRDDLPLPTWQMRLTRKTQWVLASRRASASVSVTHLFFPSDGRRGLAVAAVLIRPPNTIELSLLSSNLFPPPGEAYPSDVLSLTISHRMLPEPPQFRVSLLPTHRRDYPSGSVALVSCHDVDAGLPVSSYACRPHATLIHSMPWVSISRRMLWEPPCQASQTLFICLADRTHPSVGGVLCPIGGFMGPLGQIPPSVLWLAGADGQ